MFTHWKDAEADLPRLMQTLIVNKTAKITYNGKRYELSLKELDNEQPDTVYIEEGA